MIAAGTLDVIVADEDYFMEMAEAGYFLDLSTILSEEEIARYRDRSLYYDSPENDTNFEEWIGIEVTDSPKIVSTQSFPYTKSYYGIVVNSQYKDNARAFLEYLETP